MRFDDSSGDVEPQPRPGLARWPGLPIALEHMRKVIGGDAGARVDDRNQQLITARRRTEGNGAAVGRKLDRVAEEVREYTENPLWVSFQSR